MTDEPDRYGVTLSSTSRATDAGYRAATDMAEIARRLGVAYRLVGGNAVSLLTAVHDVGGLVPARDTADADFAAHYDVVGDPRLPAALTEQGYRQVAGNRFTRIDLASGDELAVDVLAPSFTSRLRANRPHGSLLVDEVPGVAFALARPATVVAAEVVLTSGPPLRTELHLPDVVAALCLKAYAYAGRWQRRDALDVWRLLEAAHAAGARAADWPTSATPRDAAAILRRHFGRPASQGPPDASAVTAQQARIRALVAEVVART